MPGWGGIIPFGPGWVCACWQGPRAQHRLHPWVQRRGTLSLVRQGQEGLALVLAPSPRSCDQRPGCGIPLCLAEPAWLAHRRNGSRARGFRLMPQADTLVGLPQLLGARSPGDGLQLPRPELARAPELGVLFCAARMQARGFHMAWTTTPSDTKFRGCGPRSTMSSRSPGSSGKTRAKTSKAMWPCGNPRLNLGTMRDSRAKARSTSLVQYIKPR